MTDLYLDRYTHSELINYYECYGTDPNISRLLKAIRPYTELVEDLVNHGMDKDEWVFDYQRPPGEYITYLENDVAYYQEQLEEAERRIAELESRTIIDFMNDIQAKLDTKEHEVRRLSRSLHETEKELDNTKSKLKMWSTLNADPAQLRS